MNVESAKAIVALIVTCAVNVANVCGFALDYGMLYNVALSVASVACVGYVWWKNQNVTAAAQQAQQYLAELKAKED